MSELEMLIAEQARDMRYGNEVFCRHLSDAAAMRVVGQAGVFDAPEPTPFLTSRRVDRNRARDERELTRISARHNTGRKTQAHLGGRIVTCPGCGDERRVIYLERDYNRTCLKCMGLARRKATDRCDYGHVGEIIYTPIRKRPGTVQRVCRKCGRDRAREYQRRKRSAARSIRAREPEAVSPLKGTES